MLITRLIRYPAGTPTATTANAASVNTPPGLLRKNGTFRVRIAKMIRNLTGKHRQERQHR